MLKGTNLLGEVVEMPLDLTSDVTAFPGLMPGSYVIEIPGIPFLQNSDEPRQIPVESGPLDSDVSIDPELGQLKAKYVSIRDFFGSRPRKSILVAVEAGETSLFTIASPQVDVDVSTVELDSDADTVTVRAVRSEADDQGAVTQENLEAVGSIDDASRIETRGSVGDLQLLKISLDVDDGLVFATASSTGGEGEALPAGDAEGELAESPQLQAQSQLIVGEMQAEGESEAALGVTQADLFVPVVRGQSTRSDAVVLATEQGDIWLGDSMPSPVQDSPPDTLEVIDSVMQNVADELTIVGSAGDEIVEESSDSDALDESNVDALLGGNL